MLAAAEDMFGLRYDDEVAHAANVALAVLTGYGNAANRAAAAANRSARRPEHGAAAARDAELGAVGEDHRQVATASRA